MGIFVINVDDAHLEMVTQYLDEHELNWREMTDLTDEKKGGEA